MPALSLANLRAQVRDLRLLEPSLLDEALRAPAGDADEWLGGLVRRGWITAWQASQLTAGLGRELTVGEYDLLEPLGEGGMGQVFKARHRLMDRVVALKFIRPEFLESPRAVERFRREIRLAGRLSHPNIVLAHDAAQVGDRFVLVMEFCPGQDLRRMVLQGDALPLGPACDCVRQTALGLQHAHEQGVIHRDIKPANLLLSAGVIKILDLGLAYLREPETRPDRIHLTQPGALMGTPDYLAPEQADDPASADHRSDLYSLGCVFYFLLTGQTPYPGGTMTEKLLRHRLEAPLPVERLRPGTPPAVRDVLYKLMAKAPAQRIQSAREVADLLAAFLSRASAGVLTAPAARSICLPAPATGADTPGAPSWPVEARAAGKWPSASKAPPATVAKARPRRRAAVLWAAGALAGAMSVAAWVAFVRTPAGSWQAPPASAAKPAQAVPLTWARRHELRASGAVWNLAFAPDSRFLAGACGGPDGPSAVQIWDAADGSEITSLKPGDGLPRGAGVRCLAFSDDGRFLAAGAFPGGVTVWRVTWRHDGKPAFSDPRVLEDLQGGVLCLGFRPRDTLLAAGGLDGTVRLADAATGTWRAGEGEAFKGPVSAMAFASNGQLLASGSYGGQVRLLELAGGTSSAVPRLDGGEVAAMAFAPDGRKLLAAMLPKPDSYSKPRMAIWEISGENVARVSKSYDLVIDIFCLAFAPDGRTVPRGGRDGTVMIADLVEERDRQSLVGHTAPVRAVVFAPDGQVLATGGDDGTVIVWKGAP